MSNVLLNAGSGGATLGTDTVAGAPNVDYQIAKIGFSVAGTTPVQVSASNALPVVQTGALPAGANTIGAVTQASGPWTNNLTQLAGTAVDVNSGLKSAGTLRVVLATDQPSLSNALPVLQSGSWTVTANLGTLNGAALDASVTGLQVAQGSATSGQKGPLVQGAVTTASPTYTTAQTAPFSLDTAGNLRVNVVAGGASGGTSLADNSTFTRGTTAETPVGGIAETSAPTLTAGKAAALSMDLSGGLRVNIAAGGISSGTAGTPSTSVVTMQGITGGTTVAVTDTPGTSGGLAFAYTLSAASNNLTQAKGSAGQLFSVVVTNTNAAPRYLKIFNKLSASVTMGTTAADFEFVIPGNTAGAGVAINWDKGIALGTGITYAITAGVSLTDNTSVAANEVSALIGFK